LPGIRYLEVIPFTFMSDEKKPNEEQSRRGFIKFWAGFLGAIAGAFPALAGLTMVLDPLRKKASEGKLVRVATLDSLPKDGVPRIFPVLADRVDAWNKFPSVRIGAVFLRRTEDGEVTALHVSCPHLGCAVDYKDSGDKPEFSCPCHNSQFELDGSIKNEKTTQSPRGMDSLKIDEEKLQNEEVWINFQNFQPNKPEKIAVS
jgi:menaquinol-cytochrome c reductase iron-sulfur subunit